MQSLDQSGTDGSTYWFGASGAPAYGVGKFGNGYLTVTTSLFTLEGALNTVYFNPQTGALAGNFIGIHWTGQTASRKLTKLNGPVLRNS